MREIVRVILIATLLSVSICAQQSSWDLSYESVLERNNVAKAEWIRTWLARTKSPAADWIANWKGKPIVSSILIEHPAFHAAERTTTWLIRTEDEAFYWEYVEGNKSGIREPVKLKVYDDIYKQVISWQQLHPKSADELPKDALPGYIGFLSHTDSDGARQILLTIDDFIVCLSKTCLPGEMKSGRVLSALEPILIPDAQKNYRHKTEAEIARMTPEQRIDEEIRERDHLTDATDKQRELIRKYRVLDGLKGSRRLIDLMDNYEPKRLRNRAGDALMIATDIDENSVRLRASSEGRLIIDAIERLVIRLRAANPSDSYPATELQYIKGVNFTDRAVRDTLRLRYRIKLSDAELLEFSNYMVKHHPDYPSWSTRIHALDHSQINDAGNPAQVLIMKQPGRYYQAHRAFQRIRRGHGS